MGQFAAENHWKSLALIYGSSSEQQCHTEPADIRCLQLSFHLYCNHVKASLGASVKQFSLKFNVLNAVWHFAALGRSTLQCAHDEPTDTFWRSSHYSIAFGMRRGSFVQVANWNDPYTHDSQDHTSNLQQFLLMYPNVSLIIQYNIRLCYGVLHHAIFV